MIERNGWTLHYDGEEFVIRFNERNLEARLYPNTNNKFYEYLIDMLNGTMPKHEIATLEKLNTIVNKIFDCAEILKRQIDEERQQRPMQNVS